jgi:hypothetical protein
MGPEAMIPPWIAEIVGNVPVVAMAVFIYLRESSRVDRKDAQLLELTTTITDANVKVAEHLSSLSRSIDKLDDSIEEVMRRIITQRPHP